MKPERGTHPMKHTLIFIAILVLATTSCSKTGGSSKDFQTGDLIFLDLDCGELCDAIEDVTKRQFKVSGPNLSHVGILSYEDGSWFVYEAYDGVARTPLEDFKKKSTKSYKLARIKNLKKGDISRFIASAKKRLGLPYDPEFLIGNGKYYCSELVADALSDTLKKNTPLAFSPMYYGDISDPNDLSAKVWKDYFAKRKQPVPAGKPGISPLGIYLSKGVTPIL